MRIESRLLRARAHLPPPSKKSNKNNSNNYNNNSNCNNNNKEKQRGKCCCGYKTGFRCLLLCSEVWFYNRGVLIVDFLKALKISGIYFCRNYKKCNSDHSAYFTFLMSDCIHTQTREQLTFCSNSLSSRSLEGYLISTGKSKNSARTCSGSRLKLRHVTRRQSWEKRGLSQIWRSFLDPGPNRARLNRA